MCARGSARPGQLTVRRATRVLARGAKRQRAGSDWRDYLRLYPKAPELTQRRPDTAVAPDNTRSLVNHATAVTGKIATESDVTIEGALDGELECHGRVFIAEGAKVGAKVHAAEVVVAGELHGDAVCTERLEAQPTSARRFRFIRTPLLIVQEGALVDGTIVMSPSIPRWKRHRRRRRPKGSPSRNFSWRAGRRRRGPSDPRRLRASA